VGETGFRSIRCSQNRARQEGTREIIAAENGAGRVLIADAITNFLDVKKRKNASTVENYTFILNEFLQQTSAKYIDQVDRKVLDAYITWLETEKNAAPKTVNNKVMVVVFMLKEAGVIAPYKFVKDLLPTVEEQIAEPYAEKELKKLFAEMDEAETCRYRFFLMTACREKEVAHAKWTDLVLKGNVPHFVVQAKKVQVQRRERRGIYTEVSRAPRDSDH